MRHRDGRNGATRLAVVLLCAAAVESLAGQEVVELPGADRPFESELEEVYSVGGLTAPTWAEFQSITDAAFGADGRLYLLDAPGKSVVAVSTTGELLHTVGRPGEGPGEFSSASGVVTLSGDRVAVWDFRKRAFLVFDREGEHIEEIRPDLSTGIPNEPFVASSDGRVLSFPMEITMSGAGLSYLATGGVVPAEEGLPVLSIPLENGATAGVVTHARLMKWTGGGDPPLHRAFQPRPSWGPIAGGGIALYQSDEYRVDLLARDGTVDRTLVRPIEARPTSDRDRDRYAEDLRRRYENGEIIAVGGGGGTTASRVRNELRDTWFYPRISPIREITADGNGHVWIQRRHPEDPTRIGPVDVLTTDGRYLGTLPADGPGLPLAFGPDGLVVFEDTSVLDIPVARVYRLPPALR